MAEAFFNAVAGDRGHAVSAGTQPAERVNDTVVTAMNEIGFDISRQQPKTLTFDMMERADRAITMGCGVAETCPAGESSGLIMMPAS